jgi:hypothetical protein
VLKNILLLTGPEKFLLDELVRNRIHPAIQDSTVDLITAYVNSFETAYATCHTAFAYYSQHACQVEPHQQVC